MMWLILSPRALVKQLSAFILSLEAAWQLALAKTRANASRIFLKNDFLIVRRHRMKQA